MLYNIKGKNVKIDIVPIQQRQNGFDCGVYPIAFMVSLINKEDLASISFDKIVAGSFI